MQWTSKKSLLLGFITILFVTTFVPSINGCSAQTSGAILQVPNQYPTIQEAINAANNGDTIQVASGRYYEIINVNKPVSIIGQSAETTTVYGLVEGYDQSSNGSPFYISADNVLVMNFTLKQGDEYCGAIRASGVQHVAIKDMIITHGSYSSGAAIVIDNCDGFTISSNTIIESGGIINIKNSNNGEISGNSLISLGSYTILMQDSSEVSLKNNTITNCDYGMQITNTPRCTIERNHITGSSNGIRLTRCPQSSIIDNVVADDWEGISVNECGQTTISGNKVTNCTRNFGVFGYTLDDFDLEVDTSNTVEGKPVYYLKNQNNLVINPITYPNAGYLALINCKNATVQGMTLTGNIIGLLLAHTTDSVITQNVFVNNTDTLYLLNRSDHNTISFNQISWYGTGVRVYQSSSETIIGNTITVGTNAIWLELTNGNSLIGNTLSSNYEALHTVNTNNNTIYHNNFFYNSLSGAWDNQGNWNNVYPAGGNYWGTSGVDVQSGISQGEAGSDGILDEGRYYPLAAPVQVFDAGNVNGAPMYVEVESNSTLTDVYVDTQAHIISFTTASASDSTDFCRITIPDSILQIAWQGNYTILLNGQAQTPRHWTDTQNTYFYLSYEQTNNSNNVSVIPEFPAELSLAFLVALAATLLIAVATRKTKQN
jgi:parallel beta-helix repeat protein